MERKKYDVVIIGSGVGGLSSAIYHAQTGKSVLVLEQRDVVGGKAAPKEVLITDSETSVVTDPGPSIIIMKWIYEQAFSDWGEDLSKYIDFIALPGVMDLYHEGQKWMLPSGETEFLDYIKTHFPHDFSGFDWLFQLAKRIYPKLNSTVYAKTYSNFLNLTQLPLDLHPAALTLLEPFGKVVEKRFSHPAIKGFLYDFLTYSGHTDSQPSPVSWLILYTMIKEGCYYPAGGIFKIPEALGKIAAKNGVTILTKQKAVSIKPQSNGEYIINTQNNSYSCSKIVANVDPIVTQKLLGQNPKVARKSFSYCTLTYTYSGDSTAPHHTLLLPKDYKAGYNSLFRHRQDKFSDYVCYINHPHISDPLTAKYIFVVVPVSTQPVDEWSTIVSRIDSYLAPLLKEHYGCSKLQLIDSQNPRYFEARDSNPQGSLFGSGYSWLGLLPQPAQLKYNKKIQNIVHVGGAVQPGAGLPMVMLSGKFSLSLGNNKLRTT